MTGRDGGATLTPTLSRRERGQDSEAARGLMQTLRQGGDGLAGRRDGDVDGGVAHVGERLGLLLGDLLLGLAGAPLERRFEVLGRLLADALGLGFGIGDDRLGFLQRVALLAL